jgi:hypothetical protein
MHAPIIADSDDPFSVLAGAQHRILRNSDAEPDIALLTEMNNYIRKNFDLHFDRCEASDVVNFDDWLANSAYSARDKLRLHKVREELIDPYSKRHRKVKSFIKDESYENWKNPRTINSRTDELKVIFGPIAATMKRLPIEIVPSSSTQQCPLDHPTLKR